MPQQSDGTVADDIKRRSTSSEIEAAQPLATVPLTAAHRTLDFACSQSERVTRFLREQAHDWVARRLCGTFVLTNPDDPTEIWGYYTLSQFVLSRDEMRNKDRSGQRMQMVPLAQRFCGNQCRGQNHRDYIKKWNHALLAGATKTVA